MSITKTFAIFGAETTNAYTDTEYSSLVERKTGFMPDTLANSKLATTAIMANAKYINSLIDLANNNGASSLSLTIGENTSSADILSFLTAGLSYFVNQKVALNVVKTTTTQGADRFAMTIGLGGQSQSYTFENIVAYQSQSASNATNVTTMINNVLLSNIFETNGSTVKNATLAATAIDVSRTDFSTALDVSIQIGSASVSVSLEDGATYQAYLEYDNYDDLVQPEIDDQVRVNLGTFKYINGRVQSFGSIYAELGAYNGLVCCEISKTGYLSVFSLNSSFSKTYLVSSVQSTHRYTTYTLKLRRIK